MSRDSECWQNDSTSVRQVNILVVEDDGPLCALICHNLRIAYPIARLHVATNGIDAYRVYASVRPDIVFAGMLMPGMSGPELIKKVRQNDPETKILVRVNSRYGNEREQAVLAGANACIESPFGRRSLAEAMERLLVNP